MEVNLADTGDIPNNNDISPTRADGVRSNTDEGQSCSCEAVIDKVAERIADGVYVVLVSSPRLLKHMAGFLAVSVGTRQLLGGDTRKEVLIVMLVLIGIYTAAYLLSMLTSWPLAQFPNYKQPVPTTQLMINTSVVFLFTGIIFFYNSDEGLSLLLIVFYVIPVMILSRQLDRPQHNPPVQFKVVTGHYVLEPLVLVCAGMNVLLESAGGTFEDNFLFWNSIVLITATTLGYFPYIGCALKCIIQAEFSRNYRKKVKPILQNTPEYVKIPGEWILEVEVPFAYICAMVMCHYTLMSDGSCMIRPVLCLVQATVVGLAHSHSPTTAIADPDSPTPSPEP